MVNEQAPAKGKSCSQCGSAIAPYKCPQCLAAYCSVTCNRGHKEKCGASDAKPDKFDAGSDIKADTPHSVSKDAVLSNLENNAEVDRSLRSATLRALVQIIAQTPESGQEEMLKEILEDNAEFKNFAKLCTRVTKGNEN